MAAAGAVEELDPPGDDDPPLVAEAADVGLEGAAELLVLLVELAPVDELG